MDFVNNVIYNWGFNSTYGGEEGNHNLRNNYFKYGPATNEAVRYRIVEPYDTTSNWYINGNYVHGSATVTADNWLGVHGDYADYHLVLDHHLLPKKLKSELGFIHPELGGRGMSAGGFIDISNLKTNDMAIMENKVNRSC